MTFTPVIEYDVPLPEPKMAGASAALRALLAAPAGASVFFPGAVTQQINGVANRIIGKGGYAMRSTKEGVRVWRLEAQSEAAE